MELGLGLTIDRVVVCKFLRRMAKNNCGRFGVVILLPNPCLSAPVLKGLISGGDEIGYYYLLQPYLWVFLHKVKGGGGCNNRKQYSRVETKV